MSRTNPSSVDWRGGTHPRCLLVGEPVAEDWPDEADLFGDEPPSAGEPIWDPFDPDDQEPEPQHGDFWLERDDEAEQ